MNDNGNLVQMVLLLKYKVDAHQNQQSISNWNLY